MFERLRQSLALRLAIQYALVFAVSAAVLFGALYWVLADALEKREIEAVSRRAEVYAAAYDFGGVASLNNHLNADRSPDQPAYFVRLVNADGSFQWIAVPRNWVETQIEKVPVGVFTWTRETHLVRQVLEDTPTNAAAGTVDRITTSFEPKANPPLDDGAFRFDVPR